VIAKATRSYTKQVLWSLLAAAVITVATIALVTAKIGPGLDSRELRDRQEMIEERREAREERLDEQASELRRRRLSSA
jgi:hypothetical protein